jgi:uncharacterized membrane protein YecN with MAPEG domain
MTTVPVVCIALMGVMLFLLGANVPADRMFIAQRAHGNASEYIPTLAVLIVVCATLTSSWWLNALAIAALGFRSLHAVAMLTSKTMAAHVPLRDVGALGTYATGVALGVTALVAL